MLAETRRSEGQGLESPILGPSACVREGQGGRAGCHIHAEAGYRVRLCPGRQLCTNADSSRQSGGLRSGPVSDGSSLRYITEAMLSLGTGGTVRYSPPSSTGSSSVKACPGGKRWPREPPSSKALHLLCV